MKKLLSCLGHVATHSKSQTFQSSLQSVALWLDSSPWNVNQSVMQQLLGSVPNRQSTNFLSPFFLSAP